MEIKMYKNKQDKNKRWAQETSVLIVEIFFEYIVKIADGESEDIDLFLCVLMVMLVEEDLWQLLHSWIEKKGQLFCTPFFFLRAQIAKQT